MFSPDGARLAFASNRNHARAGETNLFIARWEADGTGGGKVVSAADRFMADVEWLADDARDGRGIGTSGLAEAGRWLARRFQEIALLPGGKEGTYLSPFMAPVEVIAEDETALAVADEPIARDAFQVTGFSASGRASGTVVFAGYGITSEEHQVDDYAGVDASGKIVLVRRFTPTGGVFEDTGLQQRFSALRYKAWNARQHGAAGLLVVDLLEVAPEAELPEEAPFPKLSVDTKGDAGIPVAVIQRALGQCLIDAPADVVMNVRLTVVEKPTENVVGRIPAGHPDRLAGAILLGAHYDHIGLGGPHSLEPDREEVHNGADDNASGVAALLEAARMLHARRAELRRDVWLVAFSGEEEGLLGSGHLVRNPPDGLDVGGLVAMVNMDMVGWLRDNKLTVLGGESAEEWEEIVSPACEEVRVECALGGDGYGPSDQTHFYAAGVPVLHLFTGTHHGYHRPSDDVELINAAGGAQVAALTAELARSLARRPEPLTYRALPQPVTEADTRSYGASLGTVPDYAGDPEGRPGVLLSGVRAGSAAAAAGLQRGDLLVGLAGHEIRDIYDFVYILRNAKPGQTVQVIVIREGERLTLEATFGQRGRIR